MKESKFLDNLINDLDIDLSEFNIDFEFEKQKLLSNSNNNMDNIKLATYQDIFNYTPLDIQVSWLSILFGDLLYANTKEELISAIEDFKETKTRLFLGARYTGKSDILIYGAIVLLIKCYKLQVYDIAIAITCATYQKSSIIFNKIISEVEATIDNKKDIDIDKNYQTFMYKKSKNKFANLTCMSASGKSLRGFHCDIMFFDDLVTDDAQNSKALRNLGVNKYNEALNVAESVVLIGQPVHEYDIYNILKDYTNEQNTKDIVVSEFFVGSDKELDAYLLPKIEKTRGAGTSTRDIQKNFYGKLVIDDSYPFEAIKFESFNFNSNSIATLDPAYDGSDSIGISIGYVKDNKIYAIATKIEGSVFHQHNIINSIMNKYNVNILYVEANDNGGAFRHLQRELQCPCIGYLEKTNLKKDKRIVSRISQYLDDIVLHNDSDINEIIHYNKYAEHDDVADSLASLINFLDGNKEKLKKITS